jgi:hypothetical protein
MGDNTMDEDSYQDYMREFALKARDLGIYMTHDPKDSEFMPVLSYRVGQAIAECEDRLMALKKFRATFTA